MMLTLVCLVEESSAKALLEGVLPRILPPTVAVQYLVFQGKSDLEKNLTAKIRHWREPNSVFVVLRDQDSGDCVKIKQRLLELAQNSGKPSILIRVACRDLESWVAGDWAAVAEAFDNPKLEGQRNKAKFRDPDILVNTVNELRRIIPEYQKTGGARRVGLFLSEARSQSRSFRTFCNGVRSLVAHERFNA